MRKKMGRETSKKQKKNYYEAIFLYNLGQSIVEACLKMREVVVTWNHITNVIPKNMLFCFLFILHDDFS